MTVPEPARTPEQHRARGEELLALANVYMLADRHDRARSAATLGAAHFTAYGVLWAEDMVRAAAAPPDPAPSPDEVLIGFLRTVRDNPVRTVSGAVIINGGPLPNFSWTRVAGVAEKAVLAYEGDEHWWHLTPRGREAADRGSV